MADLIKQYWDSTMWLGLVNQEPTKFKAIAFHYEAARRGASEIYTSTIAFVEVFRLQSESQSTKPLPSTGLDVIEEMFQQDFIKLIPVDMEIAQNSRRHRREIADFGRAADAIHLASALRWSVDVLYTHDANHLIPLNGTFTNYAGRPLAIRHPDDPPELPLFAAIKSS